VENAKKTKTKHMKKNTSGNKSYEWGPCERNDQDWMETRKRVEQEVYNWEKFAHIVRYPAWLGEKPKGTGRKGY